MYDPSELVHDSALRDRALASLHLATPPKSATPRRSMPSALATVCFAAMAGLFTGSVLF